MRIDLFARLPLATATTLSVIAGSAFAQVPPATSEAAPASEEAYLAEVIVSAEKREQNLQEVPQAVTAVGEDFLEANHITNFVGLSGVVPGLTVSPAEGGDRVTVSIRGVGQEANQNDVAAPSVSFHSDGVYVVSPFALGGSFLDIDHIEVVRGPQGTLFGQNSTGGAMNLITRNPRLGEFGGNVAASMGSYDYREIESAVDLPIGDTFAIRAAVNDVSQDGSTRNVFNGQRLDDRNQTAWRVKALWQPFDSLSMTLAAQNFDSETNGAARFGLYDPTPGDRRVSQDDPSNTDLHTELYSAVVQWSLPGFTAKYLGSYQTADIVRSRDNDFTSVNLVSPLTLRRSFEQRQDQYHESKTSELNLVSTTPILGGLDWIVGAFWFDPEIEAHTFERVDQNRNGVLDPFNETFNPVVFGVPPAGADIGFQSDFFPSRKSHSIYGQGTYHVSDALRVTAGLRYTHDEARNRNFNFFNILRNRPTADITNVSEDETGRLAVEYDLAPGRLVFASYTRGFKPGGNNLTFGQPDVAADLVFASFRPETIDALEAGFKADFLDGRLRTNVAAFHYDYRDLQAQSTDPRNTASGVVNVPKSQVYGLEAEVQFAVTRELLLTANLTALESKINGRFIALDNIDAASAEYNLVVTQRVNQFAPAVTLARQAVSRDLDGNELAKTPPLAASLGAQYSGTLASGAEWTTNATLIYRDAMWARMFNNPAIDRIPGFTQVNLAAGVAFTSGFGFDLLLQNVFNRDAIASRFTDAFGVYSTFDQKIPPRTLIGRLQYRF